MEFSASITRACALQTIHTTYVRTYHARTYERTYAPSTVSRHSSAETKTNHHWFSKRPTQVLPPFQTLEKCFLEYALRNTTLLYTCWEHIGGCIEK